MKSRAEIARERIEAMVGTLPDGTKYATCPEGLSILYPPPAESTVKRQVLADIRKLCELVLANEGRPPGQKWEDAALSVAAAVKAILDRADGTGQ